jgi:hypothetical protein
LSVDVLDLSPSSLASLVIALSFATGLNVYATVCSLGLMARMHWIVLPGELGAIAHTWVIAVSGALFVLELFADKIPGFDLLWNALHTFIRIPAAALMAYAAASRLSPEQQMLVTILGGAIAAIAHSSKTAARVMVTPSPEPASNIALSSAEDVGAIGISWVAMHHPVGAGVSLGVLSLGLVWALGATYARVRAALTRSFRRLREAW